MVKKAPRTPKGCRMARMAPWGSLRVPRARLGAAARCRRVRADGAYRHVADTRQMEKMRRPGNFVLRASRGDVDFSDGHADRGLRCCDAKNALAGIYGQASSSPSRVGNEPECLRWVSISVFGLATGLDGLFSTGSPIDLHGRRNRPEFRHTYIAVSVATCLPVLPDRFTPLLGLSNGQSGMTVCAKILSKGYGQ